MNSAVAYGLLFVALAALGGGCATADKDLFPPAPCAPRKTVHIMNHGWHAGLIVARADIPTNIWPAHRAFADVEFLEVGWGEEASCRAEKITGLIALKALFGPSPSVLRVTGFNGPLVLNAAAGELVRIDLSDEGFTRLCEFIGDEYARAATGVPVLIGQGVDGVSQLYRANCSYYFPRSCNTWIAAVLRSAGCPIAPLCSVTTGCLMLQVRRMGTVVSRGDVDKSVFMPSVAHAKRRSIVSMECPHR